MNFRTLAGIMVFMWCAVIYGFEQAKEPPKFQIIVYSTKGCIPCKFAINDLKTIAGAEVSVIYDCPRWVDRTPTISWQQNTANGYNWVQFAPKQWTGATWQSQWPSVKRMIEAAMIQPQLLSTQPPPPPPPPPPLQSPTAKEPRNNSQI